MLVDDAGFLLREHPVILQVMSNAVRRGKRGRALTESLILKIGPALVSLHGERDGTVRIIAAAKVPRPEQASVDRVGVIETTRNGLDARKELVAKAWERFQPSRPVCVSKT